MFSILFEACSCGTTCCNAHAMCCQMSLSQGMSQKARYNSVYNSTLSLNEMLKIWKETVVTCCKFEEIIVEMLSMKETQIILYSPFSVIAF